MNVFSLSAFRRTVRGYGDKTTRLQHAYIVLDAGAKNKWKIILRVADFVTGFKPEQGFEH